MRDNPETDHGRVVAVQSLSNAQLIRVRQLHDDDDGITEMVEEELARKSAGAPPQ